MNENEKKISILMIDDDMVINFIVERKLKQQVLDFELNFVENGADALSWLETNGFPDMILLDLSMPVVSGFDFLNEWESRGYIGKSKIWVLTGSTVSEVEKKVNKYKDVEGIFEKPLNQMNIDVLLSKLTLQ